jgi:hypothetical protein
LLDKTSRFDALAAAITARPKMSPIDLAYNALVDAGDYVIYQNNTTNFDIRSKLDQVNQCSHTKKAATVQNFEEYTVSKYVCNEPFFCNVCADSISAKRFFEVKPAIELAISEGFKLVMLTVTTEDTENPHDSIRQLQTGFRKMYLKGQKRKNQTYTGEFSKIVGYAGNIELVTGKNSKISHIHMHLLCAISAPLDFTIYKPYEKSLLETKYGRGNVPQNELDKILLYEKIDGMAVSTLSKQWYESTGKKGINIHVKDIPNMSGKAIREAFKYPAKLTDFVKSKTPINDIFRFYDSIRYKRLYRRGGMFSARSMAVLFEYEQRIKMPNPFSMIGTRILEHAEYKYKPQEVTWTENEYKNIPARIEKETDTDKAIKFQSYISEGWYTSDNIRRGGVLADHNFLRKLIFDLSNNNIKLIVDGLKFLKRTTSWACSKLAKGRVNFALNIKEIVFDWLEEQGKYGMQLLEIIPDPPPIEPRIQLELAI